MSSPNVISSKHEQFLRRIARDEGIKDCEMVVKDVSVRGDNYLGVVKTVDVKDKNSDNVLHLFLKVAQTGDELRRQAPVRAGYVREAAIYEDAFLAFNRLQIRQFVKDPFVSTARYYGSILEEKNECIVLENLRHEGYAMYDRQRDMDEEHTVLVMKEYGRFHALSLALKRVDPDAFEELDLKCGSNVFEDTRRPEDLARSMKEQFDYALQVVAEDRVAREALERFAKEARKFFGQAMKKPNACDVVLHGDCWCNNLMFKYADDKNPKKPTKLCFIDWQLCRVASPVVDLSYFLFTCATMENIYNYKKYLKIYHDSLSEMLVDLGCDPQKLFPYSELEKQWTTYCKFGLYMAMMVTKIMMSESGEAPNLEEFADSGKDIMTVFNYTASCEERYKRRMIDLIKFFVDNNYL